MDASGLVVTSFTRSLERAQSHALPLKDALLSSFMR